MRFPSVIAALLCFTLGGCDESTPRAGDAGSRPDAGEALDAGAGADAGAPDGGPLDGGPLDAGAAGDAGGLDAGPPPPACPRIRVTTAAGETLNIRPEPSTAMAPVGSLPSGAIVERVSTVRGQAIDGEDEWFEIRSSRGDGFVFSTFAECTTDEIPVQQGYLLPFACGASVRITQAPGGATSHTGRTMFAYDFGVGLNTPIHAMAAGTVTGVRTATQPGDACYNGGGSSCGPEANWVILAHPNGETSAYKHLNSATVSVGETVARGQVIGRSGSTGYSTGPHLHLELRGNCPTEIYCQTIRLTLADVGEPTGGTVVSGNCD